MTTPFVVPRKSPSDRPEPLNYKPILDVVKQINSERNLTLFQPAVKAPGQAMPDWQIIARIAWDHVPSDENNKIFEEFAKSIGRSPPGAQSFVAGRPKNGVQFMVKDSKKYAATGGWGYAQFDDGKLAGEKVMSPCFPCHQLIKARDYVFSRYAR